MDDTNWWGREYLTGNGVKAQGTLFYLGSDKVGKVAGRETVSKPDLKTSTGVEIDHKSVKFGNMSNTLIAKSPTVIGMSSKSRTSSVLVFSSGGTQYNVTSNDIGYRCQEYPFVGDNHASFARLRTVNKNGTLSFFNVDHDKHKPLTMTLTFEDQTSAYIDAVNIEYKKVVWYDGLVLVFWLGTHPKVSIYLYDSEQSTYERKLAIRDVAGIHVSQDQRFVVLFDKNGMIGRVWDLKNKIQHYILQRDRRAITMVGMSKGKLLVATFDGNYLSRNTPKFQQERASHVDFTLFNPKLELTSFLPEWKDKCLFEPTAETVRLNEERKEIAKICAKCLVVLFVCIFLYMVIAFLNRKLSLSAQAFQEDLNNLMLKFQDH